MVGVLLLEKGRMVKPVGDKGSFTTALITSNHKGLVLHLYLMLLRLRQFFLPCCSSCLLLLLLLLLLSLWFFVSCALVLVALNARYIGLHKIVQVLQVTLIAVEITTCC